MKIGILGGTFDPIHRGHLHIADAVYSNLDLDQIQFMPCAVPVHRDQPLSSVEQRCRMVELSIAETSYFSLNTVEVDRGGPSYTVDSLREIKSRASASLQLIVGADAFNGFAGWKDPEKILSLCNMIVLHRPGVTIATDAFASHWSDSITSFRQSQAGAIFRLEVEDCDCASRDIRNRVSQGGQNHPCLSVAVAEYIETNSLYRRGCD